MSLGPIELIIILLMCIPLIIVVGIGVALLIRRGELFSGRRVRCPYCACRVLFKQRQPVARDVKAE